MYLPGKRVPKYGLSQYTLVSLVSHKMTDSIWHWTLLQRVTSICLFHIPVPVTIILLVIIRQAIKIRKVYQKEKKKKEWMTIGSHNSNLSKTHVWHCSKTKHGYLTCAQLHMDWCWMSKSILSNQFLSSHKGWPNTQGSHHCGV